MEVEQEAAVKQVKMFNSPKLLDFYDGSKPLQLSCDDSPYELRAVLTQISPDDQQSLLLLCL